jgi:hypothetical protein
MREPRNQLEKIADTISGWSSRRQRDREPRVLAYGADGRPRRVTAEAEIVSVAEQLVALAAARDDAEAPE